MDAMNLHHLAVPCIATEKERDVSVYETDEQFFLNPEAIIRYEPGGAVITPPMLYSSFVFIDEDLLNLLEQKTFNAKGLSRYIISLLEVNQIILREPPSETDYRKTQVSISGLPSQVLLDVTSYCNCKCIACYHEIDLNGYTPPLSDILKRISYLKKMGLTLFEVTGGEPFSRKDLHKILDYLHSLQMHFHVVTNGEYLADSSPELIQSLKNGLGVAVSLDGVGEVHDRIRQRAGLYDKLINGLDFLCSHDIPVFLISTLSRDSLGSVEEMIEVAKRFGTTIHFRPAIRTGGALSNELEQIDLVSHLGELLHHPNVRNGLLNTKKHFPRSRYYGCGLRKRISVDSLGRLYPCVMDRNRSDRNIFDYTQESLIDQLTKETKHFLEKNDYCRSCTHNSKIISCGGFCRFSNRHQSAKGDNRYD